MDLKVFKHIFKVSQTYLFMLIDLSGLNICGEDKRLYSLTNDVSDDFVEDIQMLDKLICLNASENGIDITPESCVGNGYLCYCNRCSKQ